MFVEAIVALAVLMLVGAIFVGILKLVIGLVLLPLKLAFFLTKGLLALVIGLPLLLIGGLLLGAVVPVFLVLVLAPIWILGGLACAFLA